MSPFGLFWQLQAALQAGAGGANCFQGPTAFVSQWGGGGIPNGAKGLWNGL